LLLGKKKKSRFATRPEGEEQDECFSMAPPMIVEDIKQRWLHQNALGG
jgi:hypothetical protein